jgi:hypothetical protein
MDTPKFWQLIDLTRVLSGGDVQKQAKLLVEQLTVMPISEIIDYQRIFDKLDRTAIRHDLREIGDLIHGGMGDSGFKDFIGWLISQGQEIYEHALLDPETLVEIVSEEARQSTYAEEIRYAGVHAYQIKTGQDDAFVPISYDDIPEDMGESLWDSVTSVEEHDRRVKEKFPKAWAKYKS